MLDADTLRDAILDAEAPDQGHVVACRRLAAAVVLRAWRDLSWAWARPHAIAYLLVGAWSGPQAWAKWVGLEREAVRQRLWPLLTEAERQQYAKAMEGGGGA